MALLAKLSNCFTRKARGSLSKACSAAATLSTSSAGNWPRAVGGRIEATSRDDGADEARSTQRANFWPRSSTNPKGSDDDRQQVLAGGVDHVGRSA